MNFSRAFVAVLAGASFGFGLAFSGMLDPSVVRGFLDLLGDFDPRLGFVFAGAVLFSAAAYAVSRRLSRPALAETFALPARQKIDAPLIGGSALFGAGWGMVGLCPGPAIAASRSACHRSSSSPYRCSSAWPRTGFGAAKTQRPTCALEKPPRGLAPPPLSHRGGSPLAHWSSGASPLRAQAEAARRRPRSSPPRLGSRHRRPSAQRRGQGRRMLRRKPLPRRS